MTADWTWDDPGIPDDELFLRKVLRRPDCWMPNVTTGEPVVKAGALQFDDNDGMSVYSDEIREDLGVPRSAVADWERYSVVEFEAGVVRKEGGVVRDPIPAEKPIGPAHALVRSPSPITTKDEKKAIRAKIAAKARFISEDPNPLGVSEPS
ncbi:hypothetical protein [Nocardioides sp. SLBN-35]|uniref:hypothetical protein n=1 Tax=Nocardioides sp. SLBN-35 TaxID=2768445 RepID=UPI0011535F55|nr:hypothetical protein [Nocardioides sp. SLBN-35]TQK68272.1 hypothetical protein FBY23_0018 [Nocardioides sp. SLBN-35]